MTFSALTYNVPSNLTTPFDSTKTNAVQPTAGQMANGWLNSTDLVDANSQNYLHNASSSMLWVMQQLGLFLPFNPDGTGKSLVATPKGGIISLKDSATGVTQYYVAQNAMAIGYTDPSVDPTNWTYLNFPTLAKFVPAYADATGTSDAITATYTVVYPVLQDGMPLRLGIVTPNTTTAPTFRPTINGALQTALTIVKMIGNVGVPLAIGDLQGVVELVYDLPNTRWILTNFSSGGNANQTFSAANGVTGNQVVNISQFGNSQAANGYSQLPNGLIIQWGTLSATAAGVAVTFPIAFPVGCFNVVMSCANNASPVTISTSSTLTTTGFTAYASTTVGVYWIAIGH